MPDAPGVYFFLGKNKKVLYIGKATSLRDRTRSYFAGDLQEVRSPLIANMVAQAAAIDWRATDSVLEALLLEASLIKTYKPKANTDLKDDKSFNYVAITKEDFPRVLVVRERELKGSTLKSPELRSNLKIFGPFPHGAQLKEAMKLIRKIFPYRDTCKLGQKRPCFNAQIGLCPGVCSGAIAKQDYRSNIRHIVLLFEGKKKQLLKALNKAMRAAAAAEEFEQAQELQRQLYALQHIQDISLIKDEYRQANIRTSDVRVLRIEAYDIAHLRGSAAVGVMTVV